MVGQEDRTSSTATKLAAIKVLIRMMKIWTQVNILTEMVWIIEGIIIIRFHRSRQTNLANPLFLHTFWKIIWNKIRRIMLSWNGFGRPIGPCLWTKLYQKYRRIAKTVRATFTEWFPFESFWRRAKCTWAPKKSRPFKLGSLEHIYLSSRAMILSLILHLLSLISWITKISMPNRRMQRWRMKKMKTRFIRNSPMNLLCLVGIFRI